MAILTKRTFCIWEFFGSSQVLLWFIVGLLYEGDREGKAEENINKSTFLVERHTKSATYVRKHKWRMYDRLIGNYPFGLIAHRHDISKDACCGDTGTCTITTNHHRIVVVAFGSDENNIV